MLIVDRIENGFAVIEGDLGYFEIPVQYFDGEVSEGDVISIVVNKEETISRKEKLQSKLDNLFSK